MTLFNLLTTNLQNLFIIAISMIALFLSWVRFKSQSDFLFWISLGLASFLSPLAYVQGYYFAQRSIQVASAGLLMLSLASIVRNPENNFSGVIDKIGYIKLSGPVLGIFIVHLYIAIRTLYLDQILSISVIFTPLYLLIALHQKVNFATGLRVLLGLLGPICILNFLTISPDLLSLQNLSQILAGKGEKFFGIFKSNHDSGFIAAIVLLSITQFTFSHYKRILAFVCLLIILLCGSRGILFPFLVVTLFQFSSIFPNSKKSVRRLAKGVGFLMIGATASFVLQNDLYARTLTGRTEVWSFYLKSILENPLLGSGAGIDSLNVSAGLIRRHFNTPHNGYITIASFGGLIILAVFVWSLYRLWKIRKGSNFDERAPKLLLFFLLLSTLTESRLNFQTPSYATYILILVLATSHNRLKDSEIKGV